MAFNLVEECKISPPPGSVSATSLSLSMFDIVLLTSTPVQRLFFYQFHCPDTLFTKTILPNLKTSLSITLQHFFPFAGKLAWPTNSAKPAIVYKDGDSVSFTVCSSDHDFSHLCGNHEKDVDLLFPLIPQLPKPSDDKQYPVLALQVTLFPDNGFCLGVTYHHAVAGGNTLIHFVKSWAAVSSSQGDTSFILKSPPFYDRSMVKYPFPLDMVPNFLEHLKKHNNITKEEFNLPQRHVIQTEKLLATFVLHISDIKKLEQWVLTCFNNKSNSSSPPPRHSTFVLTCAYVWICWIKARQCGEMLEVGADSSGDDRIEYLYFAIDQRGRLVPPLPPTYFGNSVKGGKAEGKRRDLVGIDGMAIAAELIKKAISECDGGAPSHSTDRVLSVAGSNKFGTYDIDFGWGKPKKAEFPSIAAGGAISLAECPGEAGAVEVGMVLNKIEMKAFSSLFAKTIESI